MKRNIEQYKNCNPATMAEMSKPAIFHAINDMRDDIIKMHNALEHILKFDNAGLGEIGYQLASAAIAEPSCTGV